MIWSRVATFVLKKRAFFVAIILAFTATMGYFASKVELEYNMQRLVPEDDPDVKFYDAFKEKFGDNQFENRITQEFEPFIVAEREFAIFIEV